MLSTVPVPQGTLMPQGRGLDKVLLGLSSVSDAKHAANLLPRST
jgi:hypothetical protein